MSRKIPFIDDMSSILRSDMNEIGVDTSSVKNERVIESYFTLSRRLVAQQPRTVHVATDFNVPENVRNGYESLKHKFETGQDVNPYQSRGISMGGQNDALFFDWNILHFHLGDVVERNGGHFIERTGELLFAMVCEEDVYFIKIAPHGNWSDKDLLEILHLNWPETINKWQIDAQLTMNFSSDDIKALRKLHINTFVQLNDGTCLSSPGGGYMTDGTMLFAMMERNRLVRHLDKYNTYLQKQFPMENFSLRRDGTYINAYNILGNLTVPFLIFPNLKKLYGSFLV